MNNDNLFGDADDLDVEVGYLTADNAADVLGAYEDTITLPPAGNKPAVKVCLTSASFARIQQFSQATESKDPKRLARALCALIAESVVDPNGGPVWSEAAVQSMAKSNVKRFMELQRGVLKHNGLDKQQNPMEQAEADAAKN